MQNFRLEPIADMVADADRGFEIVGGVLVEVRLGSDRRRAARRARASRSPAARRLPPATRRRPTKPAVQRRSRRREHHAEPRRAAVDQADVDGVIVAAADELLGAVERIDQEIDVAMRGDAARPRLPPRRSPERPARPAPARRG